MWQSWETQFSFLENVNNNTQHGIVWRRKWKETAGPARDACHRWGILSTWTYHSSHCLPFELFLQLALTLGVSNPAAVCSVGRALRGQSSPGRGRTQRSPGRLWLRPACDSFVLPSRGDLGTGSDHIRNLTWGQQVAQHSVKVRHFPRPRGGPCVHRIVVGMDALCAERCQGQPVFSEPRTVASWQCRWEGALSRKTRFFCG